MENKGSDMHEKILSGALEVFSRKGYADATIKEISSLAGCNAVTIFRHFEDKENLFYSVVKQFQKIEIDSDKLNTKLSFSDISADLKIIADEFFEIIFNNHNILRIFVNDGAYFEKIHEYVWLIPTPLKQFFVDYLHRIYSDSIPENDTALIGEMFLGYIVRQCLRYSVHDGKWELSDEMWQDFKILMQPELDFITSIIRLKLEA